MFFYIILFFVALQSVSCAFPPFIIRCPLPDPNENGCLLNSAQYALPYLINGNPDLGLPAVTAIPVIDTLILEYNFQTNNSVMQIIGEIESSPDIHVIEAGVNLNGQSWNFLIGNSFITSTLDFTFDIYDETRTIQGKGNLIVTQDNMRINYYGNYIKEQTNNGNFMRIQWGYSFVTDDTFDVTYTELTALDDQPFTGSDLIRVKKALRNFESSYHGKENELGENIITFGLNTILALVPENEVFLPIPNPCPQDY